MKEKVKSKELRDASQPDLDEEMLRILQQRTLTYFLKEVNDQTRRIADKTQKDSFVSIEATGMEFSSCFSGVGLSG